MMTASSPDWFYTASASYMLSSVYSSSRTSSKIEKNSVAIAQTATMVRVSDTISNLSIEAKRFIVPIAAEAPQQDRAKRIIILILPSIRFWFRWQELDAPA